MSKFKDKVVVVTGASAGLGNAIALEFAKQGAHLALISRNKERLRKTKLNINEMGSQCEAFSVDVSDSKSLREVAKSIENHFGTIDIWVNNAMVSVLSPINEMQPEEFKRVIDVNCLGTIYGTLFALECMQKKNKGVIIQIGSVLAYRGIPLQSAYCASKHAIQGFHDSIRAELIKEKSNVRVVMIQMPALNTPQFDWIKSRMPRRAQPVAPIFQPEVGVKAVLWAASHDCRELNVSFRSSLFILGNKFFPGFGDWYLAKTGFKSQQTEETEDPNRSNNLWESVNGDFGSHGRFDAKALKSSPYFWIQSNLKPTICVIIIVVFTTLMMILF